MHSLESTYLDRLILPHRFAGLIRRIGEFRGKQDLYNQQAPDILENLRRVAVIQSTESSNRLEGITADYQRIKALVEQKATPANRPESEIAGYRDVLNTIHSSWNGIPFSVNTLLQFHRNLMQYAGKEGGRWKSSQNEISEFLPDGSKKIRFVPVEPWQTDDFMRRLHENFGQRLKEDTLDPLVLIPLYVLDFLCIHPFLDGNGRMARLLSVLLLYQAGYEVCRYVSLETVVEKTKDSYYDTLYRSSQGWHNSEHDALSWVEYFLSIVLAAYAEYERRVGTLVSGRGSKLQMIRDAIDHFSGEFSISELEEACPMVGRDWIRATLRRLKREGRLGNSGHGPAARWFKA
ncbi:Fic family protein [bacterium]|nr:Fic family protein [bacterium]